MRTQLTQERPAKPPPHRAGIIGLPFHLGLASRDEGSVLVRSTQAKTGQGISKKLFDCLNSLAKKPMMAETSPRGSKFVSMLRKCAVEMPGSKRQFLAQLTAITA